jgi:glycosyltransferase involved in cell wall biosynthesis
MENNNMKILFINHEFPPVGGGGGVGTFQIAKELSKRHDVDVITSDFKGLKKRETIDGMNIHRVRVFNRKNKENATIISWISFLLTSVLMGIRLLRKHDYDIINTHFAVPAGIVGVILSKLFRVPLVSTIIGGDIYDPSRASQGYDNIVLKNVIRAVLVGSSKTVAISSDIKKRALQHYLGKGKRDISVINYGLVREPFVAVSRRDLGLGDEKFYIVTVCRLVKRKGLEYLIRALNHLKEKKIQLLIVGEGPERDNLTRLSKELGVSGNVKFLGAIWGERKYQYLSVADTFVLPSLHEGFGIVFLEGMYCKLPIITTKTGGQTDLIEDGENGFLVPTNDYMSLAKKIRLLYEDKKLRKRISENNAKKIKNCYIENTAKRYEEIFHQAIHQAINKI